MRQEYLTDEIRENYEYKETYIAGATIKVPLSYNIHIYKHKTKKNTYAATEMRTKLVKYSGEQYDEQSFRHWASQFHDTFTHYPCEAEYLMRKQGLDMLGNELEVVGIIE